MRCPHCGTNPQLLHDEVPVPVCCENAQHEAIFGTLPPSLMQNVTPKEVPLKAA